MCFGGWGKVKILKILKIHYKTNRKMYDHKDHSRKSYNGRPIYERTNKLTKRTCQKMKSYKSSQQLCIVDTEHKKSRKEEITSAFGFSFFIYMISKVHTHRVLSNIHVIKCFTIAILCSESSFFLYFHTQLM
jgi:hypothetical protein